MGIARLQTAPTGCASLGCAVANRAYGILRYLGDIDNALGDIDNARNDTENALGFLKWGLKSRGTGVEFRAETCTTFWPYQSFRAPRAQIYMIFDSVRPGRFVAAR